MKIRWQMPKIDEMEWESPATFLKYIRGEYKITQEQFAEMMRISTILVSMIETGQKPLSLKMLLKLQKMDGRIIEITN